jgi:hypothetical protein
MAPISDHAGKGVLLREDKSVSNMVLAVGNPEIDLTACPIQSHQLK